ncbi:MAG: hypothetical protein NVSMB9_01990 [Isosphaeraceae bacterium]
MELTFECLGCGAIGNVRDFELLSKVGCVHCGLTRELRPEARDGEGIRSCPLCVTEDLYIQKDFPQGLGLAIVVAGFAVSTAFWYYERPVPALSILLASALLDMVLYYIVPDVTICYRCLSQFRGVGSKPGDRFHPFDLAVGERYRQERLRVEEVRERTPKAGRDASPDS